jgi:putative endonuclease
VRFSHRGTESSDEAFSSIVIPAKAGIQAFVQVTILKQFFVYILCSKRNGTLYTGVTSNLLKRVYEHKNDLVEGFTKKYGIHCLVWYEAHGSAETAIPREKQIKKWNRQWKLELIKQGNPDWNDLYDELVNANTGFPLTRE